MPGVKIDPKDVTACLVTRGDVDMDPIIESLPYDEYIVYDNSWRDPDYKTFGRYAAAHEAETQYVYFQDDDCIFRHHHVLHHLHVPGWMTAVWGHGADPAGYEDIAIFPGGAIVEKALVDRAFLKYLTAGFPMDDEFFYYCDYVFGCLTPHVQVHLPFEIRDVAYNGRRLADEPWAREAKAEVAARARAVRDA